MSNTYWGSVRMSGNGGGGSIDTSQLTQDILDGVEEIIRPSGHQYPNTNLYPIQMTPRFVAPTSTISDTSANNMYMQDNSIPVVDLSNTDNLYAFENLDVSKFQNISHIFRNIKSSPGIVVDLSGWDVSNVEVARNIFYGIKSSDGSSSGSVGTFNLSDWDVRNISDMTLMLSAGPNTTMSDSAYLDALIVDNWNVTNVSKMDYMFVNTRIPELDLSTWDMSYVSSFSRMFDAYVSSSYPLTLEKLLWGGAINAIDINSSTPALDLSKTIITPTNANLFFQSLATKTSGGTTTIKMPTTAQGADLSIAEAKGYTISNITQP